MKDRDYFYRKAKITLDEDDWNVAKHLRKVTNFNIRQAKADFIIGELQANNDNPKKFWRTIKKVFPSKEKSKRSNIRLVDNEHGHIKENKIADYVNEFFMNIGNRVAEGNVNWGPLIPGLNILGEIDPVDLDETDSVGSVGIEEEKLFEIVKVKEIEVFRKIMKINVNKSSGFTNIKGSVLKEAFKVLTQELTYIFQ